MPSSGGSSKDPLDTDSCCRLLPCVRTSAACATSSRARQAPIASASAPWASKAAVGTRWTQPNLTPHVKACATLPTFNAGRVRRLGSREVEYISSRDRREVMHPRRAKQCTQTVEFQESKPRKLICVHCCRRPCVTCLWRRVAARRSITSCPRGKPSKRCRTGSNQTGRDAGAPPTSRGSPTFGSSRQRQAARRAFLPPWRRGLRRGWQPHRGTWGRQRRASPRSVHARHSRSHRPRCRPR